MTGLLACWVAFPLLLGLLAYGCGALLERASGRTLPLGVRLPCGVALIIGVLDLATRSTATVHAAIPVVLALAAGGLVLRFPWRPRRPDGTMIVAAVVFMAYAAPVVLSGMATWAGYVKLDDTATWLALVDRTLTAGHTLSGLAPSTYSDTLSGYLLNGYPVGSFLPLGLGHVLLGQDIAWLSDPWMAFMAGMLALSLQQIAARVLGLRAARWQAPAIAVFAAQPALLYGYYLWGGMKEMAGAMLVAAFASTVALAWEDDEHEPVLAQERRGSAGQRARLTLDTRRLRALVPVLVVVWAIFSALSAGGFVWLLPGSVLALLLFSLRRGMRLPSPRVALVAVAVCGVSAYLALRPGGFVEKNRGVLTGSDELGNLFGPLHLQQIVGIWPAGDFRTLPADLTAGNVLLALALVLGTGGLVAAVRWAHRELALYVLCSLAGGLIVFWVGSPWLGGKALATAAPAVAFVALVACAMLVARGHRTLGIVAGVAIAAGIVWSNVLGYSEVSLAPRAQFAELAAIGERIAGQGPTLMTSYSPYGARHFLRESEPESASDLRTRVDPLLSGQPLPKGATADIDQFQLSAVLAYRTLVLRRSPVASRPPSPFKLLLRDRYWEVWQRPLRLNPRVLAHLPLGDAQHPGGVPSCAAVSKLARTEGVEELATVPVENPLVVFLGDGTYPQKWRDGYEHLTLAGAGTARFTVSIVQRGRYGVWLGGSIPGSVTISVDGTHLGTARYETQEDNQYVLFGKLVLAPGTHTVTLSHGGSDWRPGSSGPPMTVGPLVLKREGPEPRLLSIPATAARSLCGRTLDWVEALGA